MRPAYLIILAALLLAACTTVVLVDIEKKEDNDKVTADRDAAGNRADAFKRKRAEHK